MSLTKRYLDELNAASEARGECAHGTPYSTNCVDCEAEFHAGWERHLDYLAGEDVSEPEPIRSHAEFIPTGAEDGNYIVSDADPGL